MPGTSFTGMLFPVASQGPRLMEALSFYNISHDPRIQGLPWGKGTKRIIQCTQGISNYENG